MSNIYDDITIDPNVHSPLKAFIVQYVGAKLLTGTEKDSVTVEMIIETLADEFPEIVLCLAEENFLRGYEQAFVDLEKK